MKCKAELHIADDEGDNHATMICGQQVDHLGPHEERYPRNKTMVIVLWEGDDRSKANRGVK
jgi:hypothetical protein